MSKHPYPKQIKSLDPLVIGSLVKMALLEDGYPSDITTKTLFSSIKNNKSNNAKAEIISKSHLVLAGSDIIYEVFSFFGLKLEVDLLVCDGELVAPGRTIAIVSGNVNVLLQGERVMLNFLSFMSSIATYTRKVQNYLDPFNIYVVDTRKTLPLSRHMSKYAVHVGGGVNHRSSLNDMGLIKDNHIMFAKGICEAIEVFRKSYPDLCLEVEVDSKRQLEQLLSGNYQVQLILLDNMSVEEIRGCVKIIKEHDEKYSKCTYIECSGGYSFENISQLEGTGIDYVSMGSLTHTIEHVDFSLDIVSGDDNSN